MEARQCSWSRPEMCGFLCSIPNHLCQCTEFSREMGYNLFMYSAQLQCKFRFYTINIIYVTISRHQLCFYHTKKGTASDLPTLYTVAYPRGDGGPYSHFPKTWPSRLVEKRYKNPSNRAFPHLWVFEGRGPNNFLRVAPQTLHTKVLNAPLLVDN